MDIDKTFRIPEAPLAAAEILIADGKEKERDYRVPL